MEEKNKIPFYKRVIMGIKDVDQYQEFATEKVSVAVKYLFKLMLIFSIVVALAFTYKFSMVVNKGISYVKNEMPNFVYENNELLVDSEEPLIFDDPAEFPGIIVIDTKVEDQAKIDEYAQKIGLYDNGILLLKERFILKNMASTIQRTQIYQEIAQKYGITNFDKQQAVDYLSQPRIYVSVAAVAVGMFILWLIYLFILYFLSALIDAFVAAVLGFITARVVGMKLNFKSVYHIGVYSLTLPILLNLMYIVVNRFTGFTIQYFQIMYTSISYIYTVTAILIIRSDLIKRQAELMKIVEEQEKVRAEKEEQKRRKKEEEEKKQVDKPKDKEEKEKEPTKKKKGAKEKKEDGTIGTEAKGEI